jgi:hypothetical protein
MRVPFLSVALLIGSLSAASAQDFMPKSLGNWSVLDLGTSCIAINRPAAEFNASPYNALAFHQFKTDTLPRLQAFFWPGALTEGGAVMLQVTPEGQSTVEIPAKAVTSFQVITDAPASADLLEALTNVASARVSAGGVDELMLFSTATLEAVADKMAECVKE